VIAHVGRVILATHPDSPYAPDPVRRYVLYGASPRGAQAMILAGKVHAVMSGRETLTEEDVMAVAIPALQHRMILNFEGAASGVAPRDLVTAVGLHD
jgi:MoxR-like ATPase